MNVKRGQNQGSVYQRGSDQRWVAQVTESGKHKLAYFYSQTEAHRWLAFALLQMRLKQPISTHQTPLAIYLETWVERMALTLRPKTLWQYRQIIQYHLPPELGNVSIQELSRIEFSTSMNAKQNLEPVCEHCN